MIHDFLEVYIDKLSKEIETLSDSLSRGNAKDYSEYQNMAGRIRGRREAIQTAKDLAKNMESNDD